MFSKNLKYYRLKKNMSKKELASLVQVTPMAIGYYESGERKPNMDTIRALAKALDVRVSDFLNNRNENLVFAHGEFRKGSKLSTRQQDYVRESVEEYMNRFYTVVGILGGEILPVPPICHGLKLSDNPENDAKALRKYLHIADAGPIGNLVELLENKGILVCFFDIDSDAFSGMNGLVNERPYIVVNKTMSPERIRSTIVHEMAHLMFEWPNDMEDKAMEDRATAISGAFLLPKEDAIRELGIRRSAVTKDMTLVCKEYGISMYLLVKRANLSGIVTDSIAKVFYIKANQHGWKRNEPIRISQEEPTLFPQLVFRAVCENEISVQKGAELLKQSHEYVVSQCFAAEFILKHKNRGGLYFCY